MTPAFIVRDNLVGERVIAFSANDRARFRGYDGPLHGVVRAIARDQMQFHLLIEITGTPHEALGIGELVICSIPDEWETVQLEGATP